MCPFWYAAFIECETDQILLTIVENWFSFVWSSAAKRRLMFYFLIQKLWLSIVVVSIIYLFYDHKRTEKNYNLQDYRDQWLIQRFAAQF